jgi:hypothetical protein
MPYLVAMIAQAAIGGIAFAAACRKYRRFDEPAFNVWLGLAMLAAWAGTSLLAILYWRDIEPAIADNLDITRNVQFTATLASATLLAFMPVTAAGRREVERLGRQLEENALARPRIESIPPLLVALSACAICLLVCWLHPTLPKPRVRESVELVHSMPVWLRMLLSGVAIFLTLASVSFIARWVYLVASRAALLIGIWLVITWAAPIFVDLARFEMQDTRNEDFEMSWISSISPIGALYTLWERRPRDVYLGLVVQALLATTTWAMYRVGRGQTISRFRRAELTGSGHRSG